MQAINSFFNKCLFVPSDSGLVQFLRYGLASVLVFLIDFSLLFMITEFLGVYYLISAALAFLVGMFLKHFFCVKWIFKRRRFQSAKKELLIFMFIGFGTLSVSELVLWLVTDWAGVYYLYSKVVVTFVMVGFKFTLRKRYLFS